MPPITTVDPPPQLQRKTRVPRLHKNDLCCLVPGGVSLQNCLMRNSRRSFVLGSAAVAAGAIHAQVTQKPKPDIFEAAESGDVPRVTELVNADPEVVHLRSSSGRTPLHYAAAAGKPTMVAFLGSQGADLSAGPESPLLAAVDYPDHEAVAEMSFFMLCNASDPNARRKDGKPALQLAAARGYADVAE